MVVKPYREINRHIQSRRSSDMSRVASVPSDEGEALSGDGTSISTAETAETAASEAERRRWETAGTTISTVAATAKGVGNFMGAYYKGMMVDIPLATTEGLRAIPRLYGEEVEEHVVRDWKSGLAAGGKNFASGMGGGLSGFLTGPYKGAAKDGPLGVAKGFAKGVIGVSTKAPSGKLRPTQYACMHEYNVTRPITDAVCSGIRARGLPGPRCLEEHPRCPQVENEEEYRQSTP